MKKVVQTNITPCHLRSRGKVRDIYDLDEDKLLIVTTDRMSAFDVIMSEPIPFKGVILNQLTIFWMNKFKDIIPNHIIESDINHYPKSLEPWYDDLENRSVIVHKAAPLPIECIVRGFITGSGWKDYQKTGSICGHILPKNLKVSQELNPAIFTPSTKAELGSHDENISREQTAKRLGEDLAQRVEEVSLKLYESARDYAKSHGILLADTKFEFGFINGELCLIDEVLTPDSSRFWPQEGYEPGKSQPSFDKQFLRDWLSAQPWDKKPPAPHLPEDVIARTQKKYIEAYEILTGKPFLYSKDMF